MTFPIRKIIHIDMDAFFASVEQMDHPSLKGKAIAVGGSKERGVVAAASYEARKYGIRSAMPSVVAMKKCPDLIFVPPRFDRYKEISLQIQQIYFDYTDLVEPLSLDEAFLDVTENKIGNPSATSIAREIRERIKNEVGLTASAGISINKFLAKVASDMNKPNGQKTIPPDEVLDFMEKLPIQQFFGVGKKTAEKMIFHGIFTGKQLKEKSLIYLVNHFGKSGKHFYNIVRGIHHSKVKPDRIRKSIGAERTFQKDLDSEQLMIEQIQKVLEKLEKRISEKRAKGRTITLKIKFSDFKVQTRSKTRLHYYEKKEEIYPVVVELLRQEKIEKPVRLLGVTLSNLYTEEKQKSLSVQMKFEF